MLFIFWYFEHSVDSLWLLMYNFFENISGINRNLGTYLLLKEDIRAIYNWMRAVKE